MASAAHTAPQSAQPALPPATCHPLRPATLGSGFVTAAMTPISCHMALQVSWRGNSRWEGIGCRIRQAEACLTFQRRPCRTGLGLLKPHFSCDSLSRGRTPWETPPSSTTRWCLDETAQRHSTGLRHQPGASLLRMHRRRGFRPRAGGLYRLFSLHSEPADHRHRPRLRRDAGPCRTRITGSSRHPRVHAHNGRPAAHFHFSKSPSAKRSIVFEIQSTRKTFFRSLRPPVARVFSDYPKDVTTVRL